jgi:lysophospholipase L1-like esterase
MRKLFVVCILFQLISFSSAWAMGEDPPEPSTWDGYTVGDQMTAEQEAAFFSNYVAIGDSLTHGCQGLNVEEGRQKMSMPAQLARAMNTDFVQPLVRYPGVGIPNPEDWIKQDNITALTLVQTLLLPIRVDPRQGNVQNFGVTGATLNQILNFDASLLFDDARPFVSGNEGTPIINDLVGAISPFFNVVIGGSVFVSKSAVNQALEREPTFLTVWIGNNDTMFSTIMGDPELNTGLAFWENQWEELVRRINDTPSVRGVMVVNLPDNTAIPFLQPINNPFHTVDDGADVPEGSKVPFFITKSGKENQVLTPDEIQEIQERVLDFNAIIADTCTAENWAMIDAYSVFKDVPENGWTLRYADGSYSDIIITDDYAYGGMFSLDGIHPTNPGYAHMANIGIDTINAHYGTSLPYVDEVEAYMNDTLCQAPVDPREHKLILGLISEMFNLVAFPLLD